MKLNALGRTGLRVSQLGFGCGSIGGILVRGDYPAMRQAVARAIELGINYFDTAAAYGSGQSEANLGAVLRELGASVIVGSKASPSGPELDAIRPALIRSVEGSLKRLGRDTIDVLHLHNRLDRRRQPEHNLVGIEDLPDVLWAFETLQQQGKIRFWGLNGLGPSDVLHEAVGRGDFHTIQIPYNLLNPSAGTAVAAGFPFQDYEKLIDHAARQGMGVLAFRILAGGALSGSSERHPVAAPSVDPISTENDYSADVARANRFQYLVEEGAVSSLVELAVRFAANPGVSSALLGMSSMEQLEQAVAFVEHGPLPAEILARIAATLASPAQAG
jgi:aryl-alcohol dehydrogenase-like predicted oxidoreductase